MIDSVPMIMPNVVFIVIGCFRMSHAVVTAVMRLSVLACMTTGMGRVLRA